MQLEEQNLTGGRLPDTDHRWEIWVREKVIETGRRVGPGEDCVRIWRAWNGGSVVSARECG
jgi:hypothetical protein